MGRKIIYLLVLGVSFFYAGLYHSRALLILFWTELFLFAGLLVLSRCLCFSFQAEISEKQRIFENGSVVRIRLSLKNRAVLPVTDSRVYVQYENKRAGEQGKCVVERGIDARGTVSATVPVSAIHCGKMELSVKKAVIYDYIRLFGAVKRLRAHDVFLVLPPRRYLDFSIENELWQEAGEETVQNLFRESEPADYQLRTYRPGDHPKTIHWKLLARTDELWIRSFHAQREHSVALYLDLYRYHEASPGQRDIFYEILTAVVLGLMRQEVSSRVCWYDLSQRCLRERTVRETADYEGLMEELYDLKAPEEKPEEAAYREEALRLLPCFFLSLNMEYELRRGQELLVRFTGQHYREQLDMGRVVL